MRRAGSVGRSRPRRSYIPLARGSPSGQHGALRSSTMTRGDSMEAAAHAHSHDPLPSRWPIITALGAGLIPVGLVSFIHGWKQGLGILLLGVAILIFGAGSWWAELLRDRFFGRDAVDAERRLRTAMFFFIASE